MTSLDELLAAGQVSKARSAAEFRLNSNRDDMEAIRALAKINLVEGHLDLAERYTARLEVGGPTVDTLILRANAAGQRGDLALAEKLYRSALESPDAPAEAWFGLGLLLLDQQAVEEACRHFETAHRLQPRFGVYEYYLAEALGRLNREPTRVVELLASAVQHNPRHAPSYAVLSKILNAAGRHREATDLLVKGLALLPGNALLLSTLTSAAFLSGDVGLALSSAVELVTLYQDDPVALSNVALLLLAQEQYPLVFEICADAKTRGITNSALKCVEATACLAQKPPDFERATAAYEEAMLLDREDWRAANDLGRLLLQRTSAAPNTFVPRAVAVLEESLRRKPDQPEPKLNLALAYVRSGNQRRALELAQQLLRIPLSPDDPVRDQAQRLSKAIQS